MDDIEKICTAMESTLAKFFTDKGVSHEAIKTFTSDEELKSKLGKLSPKALRAINLIINELLESTKFEVIKDIPKILDVEAEKGDILRAAPYTNGEYTLFLGDKAVCLLCDDYRNNYYQALF